MELYQFDCVLHEPREDQGWLYMAEIPELPGCRAWAETPNDALTELSTVAEHFILSYRDRGKPLPAGIAQSVTGQGKISIALWLSGNQGHTPMRRVESRKDINLPAMKGVDGQNPSAKPRSSQETGGDGYPNPVFPKVERTDPRGYE